MSGSFNVASTKVILFVTGITLAGLAACAAADSKNPIAEAPSPALPEGGAPDASYDAAAKDAGTTDAATDGSPTASDYCETTVASFCAFYMRCGRMAANDEAECRGVFLETCNAKYEPRYVDLEEAGLIALSPEGVAACTAHLEKVACAEQVQDLDGPCARMWVGSSPEGAPCGIDVESFVCGDGTACTLDLDLCGTCEKTAERGASCTPGAMRCAPEDACVEGKCVARALRGDACSDATPCVTGATCSEGTCTGPVVVGEGAACDARHRCPYLSYCEGGKCTRASLLGEPCTTARACASGFCDGTRCVPLKDDGETCGASTECASAQCSSGKCTPLPTACLDPSRK